MKLRVKMDLQDEALPVSFSDPCGHGEDMPVNFGEAQTITTPLVKDYDHLDNRPSVNGHLLTGGENTLADLGMAGVLPAGGSAGDIIIKCSSADYDMAWVAPAGSVEEDNTRPITSAAVYREVGNINALLATI